MVIRWFRGAVLNIFCAFWIVAFSQLAFPATAPSLNISPALTHVPVVQGTSATDMFSITTGGGFQGTVSLSLTGLPAGVTYAWSQNPVSIIGNAGSAQLTLTASPTATVNWFTFTVTATGDGLVLSRQYTVEVGQAPGFNMSVVNTTLSMTSIGTTTETVTATPFGGAVVAPGAQAAVVSGLPSGVSAKWSAPAASSNGSVSWQLTLTGSNQAAGSTSTLALSTQVINSATGQSYLSTQNVMLKVAYVAPTMTFAPAATHIPVLQGQSVTDVFNFSTGGSFQGNISLSVTGLPSGVTASWSSNPVTINSGTGTSTLTLSVSPTTTVNWYTFTVTATGDGMTVTGQYTVQVGQAPGFRMSVVNTTLSMTSIGATTETVTVTPFGGATVAPGAPGSQATVVSGLPSGVTATWSAPTVSSNSSVSWVLTLTGSNLAVGTTGTLTLSTQVTNSGNGQSYASTATATLKVVFVPPSMSFAPVATHLPVIQGQSVTDVFNFSTGGSFHGGINLSVAGLPSFVTASWSSNPVTVNSGKGSSTLTLSASPTASVNWFAFSVTASGDGLSTTWQYTVEVEPSAGVNIKFAQPALSVMPGQSATLSVTAQPLNGILVAAGAPGASVAIVSGLPSGFTSTWSAPSVTSSGAVNWTLNLKAPSNAQAGSNTLGVAVTIADKTSGTVYSASQTIPVLTSLVANLSIGSAPGVSISPTFMGLSHEWGGAQVMMGSSATGVNAIYRQLLTNLTAYGSGPVNIRIGGNSTDVSGTPTSTTVAAYSQLFQALGSQFELGVNLGSDNVSLAVDQAKAYTTQMPSGALAALEVGNEPDLYATNGLRPSNYTVQDYLSDFATWRQNILAATPSGTKVMGTAWASTAMLTNLAAFESAESGYTSYFSQHFYATSPLDNPADDVLLKPAASTSGASAVKTAVACAHTNGNPFRIGEISSISDEGITGVSNSFSSALWSVDTMFSFASVGVDGLDWATNEGNPGAPFSFATTNSSGKTTYSLSSVNPLYYGLLLFQKATGKGARLLPVTLNTAANLTAWATVDSTGTPRLVILNKDENASGTIGITLPGYSQATYEQLIAPSYKSTSGVTLGGQTFDGSTNGEIQGTLSSTTIEGTNGFFELPMPTTSAVLVVFSK